MEPCFEIDTAITLIQYYHYKNVILQFPDELLHVSIPIYQKFVSCFDDETYFYIVADSTYGSSVDDVSALHVNGDVLLYFGSDLSSSGSIPVMILPQVKTLDNLEFVKRLISETICNKSESMTVIICDPSYYKSVNDIVVDLSSNDDICNKFVLGRLPPTANLAYWSPNSIDANKSMNNYGNLGGLYIDECLIHDQNIAIVYIGDKKEQITNIMLRMSENYINWFSPHSGEVSSVRGIESREFHWRFGGLSRVRDAKVVGIIVGSMGLSDSETKCIIERLTRLLDVSRKQHLVFVMGRMNEAKLCNFPEVDIYCLIANEDVSLIKPKYV